jgi:hypothetical protein
MASIAYIFDLHTNHIREQKENAKSKKDSYVFTDLHHPRDFTQEVGRSEECFKTIQ